MTLVEWLHAAGWVVDADGWIDPKEPKDRYGVLEAAVLQQKRDKMTPAQRVWGKKSW